MSIIVIDAKPDDEEQIQRVFYKTWLSTYPNKECGVTAEDINEHFKDAYSENKIKALYERIKNIPTNSKFFVAQDHDTIVGVCRIFIKEDFNQLQAIYVLPEHQGKGVGGML